MGVMMLAAAMGSKITLEANGADEQAAIDTLKALINDYFDEGE
jgi:phosphocarrier protein